jgi:hypothetical protein
VTAASFIASLVSSLAWPAVIVAILVIFHRQFGTMLDRLARVRIGAGAGAAAADPDWSAAEAAVRQSLAAARPPIAAGPGGRPADSRGPGGTDSPGRDAPGRDGPGRTGPRRDGPGRDGPGRDRPGARGSDAGGGSGSPRDAAARQALVEDRWQALAGELRDLIARSGAAGGPQLAGAGFEQLMDIALRAGRLDSATVRALDGLAHLRNLARSSTGLTEQQAQEFGVLADAVSYTMRRGSQPSPGQPGPGQPAPGQPGGGQPGPGHPAPGQPTAWPAS